MTGDTNPVHIRLLESMPKERIRTHEQRPGIVDIKSRAQERRTRGVRMEITSAMLSQYVEMKRAKSRHIDIKHTLCVSTRTMARLRDKALQEGLL